MLVVKKGKIVFANLDLRELIENCVHVSTN